jgi:pseudouridine kinase
VLRPQGLATAEYAAIIDGATGRLHVAAVAMDAAEAALGEALDAILAATARSSFVFADANLPAAALARVVRTARTRPFRLALDAVSVAKCTRLPGALDGVSAIFMNTEEAATYLGQSGPPEDQVLQFLRRGAAAAIITRGDKGVVAGDGSGLYTSPAMEAHVVDVTGAGDSLIAATLWRLGAGDTLPTALRWGCLAAGLTVETLATVHPAMSAAFLAANLWRMPPS